MPKELLFLLEEYYKIYKPTVYLFESNIAGKHYSHSSFSQILINAKHKAKIKNALTSMKPKLR